MRIETTKFAVLLALLCLGFSPLAVAASDQSTAKLLIGATVVRPIIVDSSASPEKIAVEIPEGANVTTGAGPLSRAEGGSSSGHAKPEARAFVTVEF